MRTGDDDVEAIAERPARLGDRVIVGGHEARARALRHRMEDGIERQERISEDVIRYLSIRVDEHEEGPSAMMRKADRDRERDDRGGGFRGDRDGGFRGDRDGGFRGDRDGGGFRGDRGPRRPREDAETSGGEEE